MNVLRATIRPAVMLMFLVVTLVLLANPASAQISVTSATPNSTVQGTTNLNVTIGGKGFQAGAKAQWFISGTTNPGGVTVNSTAFVNSTTLTANITRVEHGIRRRLRHPGEEHYRPHRQGHRVVRRAGGSGPVHRCSAAVDRGAASAGPGRHFRRWPVHIQQPQ